MYYNNYIYIINNCNHTHTPQSALPQLRLPACALQSRLGVALSETPLVALQVSAGVHLLLKVSEQSHVSQHAAALPQVQGSGAQAAAGPLGPREQLPLLGQQALPVGQLGALGLVLRLDPLEALPDVNRDLGRGGEGMENDGRELYKKRGRGTMGLP